MAPAHTTVFEDTAAGIRAARAAGAGHVIGIGKRALDSDADLVVPDLAGLAWDGTSLTVRADALLRGPADPDLLFLPTHLRDVPSRLRPRPGAHDPRRRLRRRELPGVRVRRTRPLRPPRPPAPAPPTCGPTKPP
ncbi:hypothetical protein ACU686_05175 [Yinghuangia aomiensis]